jgi:hypothetical protein
VILYFVPEAQLLHYSDRLLDGTPVHEVLSEANLTLGGIAVGGSAGPISAGDFAAALFVGDDAFKDGLLPSGTFVDGEVFTPSSYLIAPAVTAPAAPEASLALGFAGLALVGYRVSRKDGPIAAGSCRP